VLGKISLTLAAGEITLLLGPNGAGKTTLLSILATLMRPTSGAVRYGAAQIEPEEVRRRIGFLGHDSLCYGDLTAAENLRLFARLYGVPARRADELLEQVALSHVADKITRTFSRGMTQRLALARALVAAPELLLLDEPFTGLDRDGVNMLRALLADEAKRGAVVLLVTHDFAAVSDLAARVIGLHSGAIRVDAKAAGANLAALYDDFTRA
jgi:heme exporter protein A